MGVRLWGTALGLLLASSGGCGGSRRPSTPTEVPTAKLKYEVALAWKDLPAAGLFSPRNATARLVAPDGVELELRGLEVRAVLEGPLAFSEVHLTFANPTTRTLEGAFVFELPPGASVSRFAMRVGTGQPMEGEIVGRPKAESVYQSYVVRRRDPAILTQDQGSNDFRFRVYPIAPNEEREIILSYSHELPHDTEPYRFPLLGLGRLPSLKVRVVANGHSPSGPPVQAAYVLEAHDVVPDRDFVLPQDPRVRFADAVRAGRFAIARVTPNAGTKETALTDLTLLVDTSAGSADSFALQVEHVQTLARLLGAASNPTLRVVAFDQSVEEIFTGRARDFGPEQTRRLLDRAALGATDLEQALRAVRPEAAEGKRLIVLTDCNVTLNAPANGTPAARSPPPLHESLEALRWRGLVRADVLAEEPHGYDCAKQLSEAGQAPGMLSLWGYPGTPLDLGDFARKLGRNVPGAARFDVPGSRWVHPRVATGIPPGQSVLVFAELPEERPFVVHDDATGDTRPTAVSADDALVARAAVRARIGDLSFEEPLAPITERAAIETEIVKLSRQYRVLSPFTALLVLESSTEYARWNIDQRASGDILTVSDWQLDHRRPSPPRDGPSSPLGEPVPADDVVLEDSDGDGVPDELDACPNRPGVTGGDANGCPAMRKILIEGSSNLLLLEPVRFEDGSTKLQPSSYPLLDEMVMVLRQHPEDSAELDGFTDLRGPPRKNQRISEERARAVMAYLKSHGISAKRLTARGFGGNLRYLTEYPGHRDDNERVEIRLLDGGADYVIEPEPIGPGRTGAALEIQTLISGGAGPAALALSLSEYRATPGPVSAIGVGESFEQLGKLTDAARAYGSLLDFADGAPPLRGAAGYFAAHLSQRSGPQDLRDRFDALALSAFTRAAATMEAGESGSKRDLAFELLRQGRAQEALSVLMTAVSRRRLNVLGPDAEIAAAAAIRAAPETASDIDKDLVALGLSRREEPSLSVVLSAAADRPMADLFLARNDAGRPTYSAAPPDARNDSLGGTSVRLSLYGASAARSYRIGVQKKWSADGPAIGRVQIVHHDGRGNVRIEERPFLIQAPGVLVELGTTG